MDFLFLFLSKGAFSLATPHQTNTNTATKMWNALTPSIKVCVCKLDSFYPSVSPLCSKCNSAEGSLGHLFWACPKLTKFWSDILKFFFQMYLTVFSPHPEYCAILGGFQDLSSLSPYQHKAIQYGMVIAKRNILSLWKGVEVPSFKTWLAEMTNLLQMEKIRYDVSLKTTVFDRMWQPFLSHLSTTD